MNTKSEEQSVTLDEAHRAVAKMCRRLGLLHLAFAETMVDALGSEKGIEMTVRAIERYGRYIGEAKQEEARRRGFASSPETFPEVNDLPRFGIHDRVERTKVKGENRIIAWGCEMAKVWREYGQEDLGRIYCYVDPINAMAYNPKCKLIHIKAEPDGDDCCELALRKTTEEEREAFRAGRIDWEKIDRGL